MEIRKVNKQLNCLVPNKINECRLSLRVCLNQIRLDTADSCPDTTRSVHQSLCLYRDMYTLYLCAYICLAQIQFEQSGGFANK